MSFDLHCYMDRNGKPRASITDHEGKRWTGVQVTPEEIRVLTGIAIRAMRDGDLAK